MEGGWALDSAVEMLHQASSPDHWISDLVENKQTLQFKLLLVRVSVTLS